MARRGISGSGDYSGTFASLYSYNRDSQKAQQDAADADAADKWSNGLMTDDEWLAYIRTRIDAEGANPKKQESWITALRKYSTTIADKQAEQAYESGGTINELIAHYQTRLTGMQKESNEYREVQAHLNDLLDKRAGNDVSDQADDIIAGINKGTKTYGDLQHLLRSALDDSRPNSDLRNSLEKQLKQVNETVRSNKLEGSFEKLQYRYDAKQISGRTYAAKLRSMAQQFKVNDPKRYFQILEAAVQLDQNGGGLKGSGGGHRGGGGKKAINQTIDSIQADRNNTQALIEQFESGAPRGVDPATGAVVVFNEAKVKELDKKLVSTFDKLAAAYTSKGDLSAAANTQKSRAKFIATSVVSHNTYAVEDSRRELMVSTSKLLDDALGSPDPTRAMQTVRFVAKQWDDFSTGLTKVKVPAKRDYSGGEMPYNRDDTFGGAKGQMDQVDPNLTSDSSMFAAALKALSTPGIDDASALAALQSLQTLTGRTSASGDPTSSPFVALATRALEVNSRQQGLTTGDLIRVATPGGLVWARTEEISVSAPDPMNPSNAVQTIKKVPTQYKDGSGKWQDLPVDGKKSKLVDIFVDINGHPTKVSAIAQLTSPQGFDGWVAGASKTINGVKLIAGQPLTSEQLKRVAGSKSLGDLKQAGVLETAPIFNSWLVTTPAYTDSNGVRHESESWNQDPETGAWYKGALPVRGVQRDEYGMVKYDQNGAMIDWKSYASDYGVPAPYAGSTPQEMQNLLNSGAVDVSGLKSRDLTGAVSDEPGKFDSSYWDSSAANLNLKGADAGGSWWSDEDRKARTDKIKVQEQNRLISERKDSDSNPMAAGIISAVSGLAKAFGINLDGFAPKKPMDTGSSTAEYDRWSHMGDFMAAKQKAAATSSAPVVKQAPPTASGPSLAVDLDIKLPGKAKDDKFVPHVAPNRRPEKDDVVVKLPPKKTPKSPARKPTQAPTTYEGGHYHVGGDLPSGLGGAR